MYNAFKTGWTGAKLAQLLQEAALVAVRKGHDSILQSDIDDAVDRLTVGPKRVGIELGHQGQCRRATTEVGSAITSHLLRRVENAEIECCDRISINPRGQVLHFYFLYFFYFVFQMVANFHFLLLPFPHLLSLFSVFQINHEKNQMVNLYALSPLPT